MEKNDRSIIHLATLLLQLRDQDYRRLRLCDKQDVGRMRPFDIRLDRFCAEGCARRPGVCQAELIERSGGGSGLDHWPGVFDLQASALDQSRSPFFDFGV